MTVPAAGRTLDIIETFARERRPMSVSMLAKATGMPLSSCHGLVKTLEARGYLMESKTQGGYYMTRLLGHLARSIEEFDPLPDWIVPALAEMRDKCEETVVLAKLVGATAQYVEVLESEQSIRFIVRVGDTRPLYASAVGKALLGTMPDDERDAMIAGMQFARRSRKSISSRAALLKDLEASRARGWYMSSGEYFDDVSAVADAMRIGKEYYAVAIAGPSTRIEPALDRHVKLITAFARNWRASFETRAA
ncbi:IclR family transcriptional regulator [Cupriavidus cauae]|uniref:IclR family transcriptional regulator n=1 Tax=Cupriavidus TaxID=106589 RepID=UPI001CF2504C|nr:MULTISPECIES: IclR family transcriptional regulator [Cupriavidus]MCA7082936.1 IclR family transcriptional regulator [Cupriavidus sp. DB3]UZN51088.1 IclR family transcriptional regulator [Cupriavidus cauae]